MENEQQKDPLTGGTWATERLMYVRYHGLSNRQATNVMLCTTYAERDALCAKYQQQNNGKAVI
jgi:hypothetical protein